MLLQRLKFLPGLETHCLAGWNGNFRSCAGIATDTCLAWLHCEDAKATKFNTIALFEGTFHFSEDSFHGHLGLGFRDSCLAHNFVDDIQLDQGVLQFGEIAEPRQTDDSIGVIPMSRA